MADFRTKYNDQLPQPHPLVPSAAPMPPTLVVSMTTAFFLYNLYSRETGGSGGGAGRE